MFSQSVKGTINPSVFLKIFRFNGLDFLKMASIKYYNILVFQSKNSSLLSYLLIAWLLWFLHHVSSFAWSLQITIFTVD